MPENREDAVQEWSDEWVEQLIHDRAEQVIHDRAAEGRDRIANATEVLDTRGVNCAPYNTSRSTPYRLQWSDDRGLRYAQMADEEAVRRTHADYEREYERLQQIQRAARAERERLRESRLAERERQQEEERQERLHERRAEGLPDPTYCSGCGVYMEAPETCGTFCEDCNVWRCEGCGSCEAQDRQRQRRTLVHSWNYRPRHFRPKGNFRTADGGEPLMGVELEVGHSSELRIAQVAQSVDPEWNHIYVKRDGSITGAEIVTHPMTLQYAKEFPFPELLQGLRDIRCRQNDGYGLHVHVSRNAFRRTGKQRASQSHQMRWLLFLYRNTDALQALARRSSDRWASFSKPASGELVRKARYQGDQYNDSRYVAVNCNNERTFELRFFRSTTKEKEFYAAIEFADASVKYTRGINAKDVLHGQALTWDAFSKWVAKNGEVYPNLLAEIQRIHRSGRRAELKAQREAEARSAAAAVRESAAYPSDAQLDAAGITPEPWTPGGLTVSRHGLTIISPDENYTFRVLGTTDEGMLIAFDN